MPQEERLTPAEEELAAALGRLAPARPRIDRDRLLFLAGRASARRALRGWQGAAAAMAACLAAAIALRPAAPGVPPVVPSPAAPVVARHPAAPEAEPWPALAAAVAPRGGYARLRDDVLRRGVAALPPMGESRREGDPLTLADARQAPALRRADRAGLSIVWSFLLPGRANP